MKHTLPKKRSRFVLQIQTHLTLVLLSLALLLAIPPRIWNLSTTPPPINDEAANVRDISHMLSTHDFNPIHMQWDASQAYLSYYPTIAVIILMHTSDYYGALRMTSVLLSIAALIPFFFLAKRFIHPFLAFSATLLFSYSYYYLEFSRVGWSAGYALTLGLFLLWITWHAKENSSIRYSIFAGLLAALLLYTYQGGIPYLVASILLLVIPGKSNKKRRNKILAFSAAFVLGILPWIIQILTHWNQYWLRSSVVSAFSVRFPYHSFSSWTSVWLYQITTTVLSWIVLLPIRGGGIEDMRYLPGIYPPISPLIIPLWYVGVFYAIKHFKTYYSFLCIYGIVLVGQIATINPPNGARALAGLPVIYLFIGLGAFCIYRYCKSAPLALQAMVFASFFIAYTDFSYYTYWMSWIQIINR